MAAVPGADGSDYGVYFFQSALPAKLSDRESGGIVRLLAGWLNADADWLTFVVRKAAHFTEYLVLGLALAGTARDVVIDSCGVAAGVLIWLLIRKMGRKG